MKILQIHNDYQIPGGETVVVNKEYDFLKQNGYQVKQYIVNNSSLNDASLVTKVQLFFSLFFSVKHYRRIRQEIQNFKPDVVHIHNVFPLITPSAYYAVKKEKIKLVQSIHNYRFICTNGLFYINNEICEKCKLGKYSHAVRNKCYRNSRLESLLLASVLKVHYLLKTFYSKIDVYVAVSDFVKTKLIENNFKQDKIIVKYNICNDDIEKSTFQKEDYFLYFGRLSKEKGLEDIIALAKKFPEMKFKIMGSGELETMILDQALSNIELLGFVKGDQKNEIIQKSIAVIVPSKWYESFGMVAVESMMNSTAIITTGRGGLKELIKESENGYIYETFEELRQVTEKLHKNRDIASSLGKKAYHYAKENFNLKYQIESFKKIYD